MDQVLSYMDRQVIRFQEDDGLTAAMVNNYTKSGLVPRAEGKKYSRDHLAYLTAITALKQVLSVREMRALTAIGRERRDSKRQYEYFWKYLDEALTSTARRLDENTTDHDLPKVVLELALRSYADGLACRQMLAIMAQRTGHGELLTGEKKKGKKEK